MREKRRRNGTTTVTGLSTGQKLNRNRLLAECDLRWNWIGTEAKHVSEITKEHCVRAAGLALLGSKRLCLNKYSENYRSHSLKQPLAHASEDGEDIIVISDGEEAPLCDKKRCRDNPYCLNYLGQETWEDEEKAEEAYLKVYLKAKDPQNLCRGVAPVGLKNLGATCYANAFLQVWFQDLAFRSGVYRCQPSTNNALKFRDSPIFQLQVTFTALQEGNQSVFNPIKLVESLRLRTSEQQDAQEFSKLFMSHLDDEFKKQSNPELQSLLSNQFEGKMVHATVCDKCKTRSERETAFLELEVNLEKSAVLEDRIASILQPERLDDNNQYWCSVCESLQDATRYTELRTLPPVLHISVLRFVYDFTTYERRKSKLPLKFPPYLNMKPFLQTPHSFQSTCDVDNDSELYELRGVLLHKGPSAYHGHYEAQVYNQAAKKWYQFNDETVTPLSSFYSEKPVLNGNGEVIAVDDDGNRPVKRQRRTINPRRVEDSDEDIKPIPSNKTTVAPRALSSKDAYMLIYARREDPTVSNSWPLNPPTDALEIIRSSNEAHAEACADYKAKRGEKRLEFLRIRDMMRDIYSSWHLRSPSKPSNVVSKTALEKWLSDPFELLDGNKCEITQTEEEEIFAEKQSGCSNSDVEMDRTSRSSATPVSVAKIIDSTSLLCTGRNGHECQLNPLSDKDMKIISRVARDKIVNSGFTFVPEFNLDSVCKICVENEFLEKLYQMEHPRLVEKFNDVSVAAEDEGFWISKAWLKDWQLNKPKMHVPSEPDPSPENVSDDLAYNFRSHIYCEHDNLSINSTIRRRISVEAVQLLRESFQDWNPPPWDAETCPACDVDVHISKESKLEQRKAAENEKAQLSRLNNDNIFGRQGVVPGSSYSIVPAEFIHHWRKWLIKPGDSLRPSNIRTQDMLCDHGQLNLDVSDEADFDNDIAVVTVSEWERLLTLYDCGPMIRIECRSEFDDSGHERRRIVSELLCCMDCRIKRRLNFHSTKLTVVRLNKDQLPHEASATFPSIEKQDCTTPSSINNGKNSDTPVERNALPNLKSNGIRQSRRLLEGKKLSRHRVDVQKLWTIKDVKVAIAKVFKIPTISQRLFYRDKELDDNSKTVAELDIFDKDTLYLREAIEDAIILDSDVEDEIVTRKNRRAEGDAFRGTLLSGGINSSQPSESTDPPLSSSPSMPLQKPCSTCTLLNSHDAEQCEACEAYF